jgi:addiction module RelE/StbE family toxin
MKVKFSKRFSKQYDKSPEKVKSAFGKRLTIFMRDKFHPLLNNHSLSGKYKNLRSISVTGDWRAIFQELRNGELIFFEFIGTHSQLYK